MTIKFFDDAIMFGYIIVKVFVVNGRNFSINGV